MEEWRIIPSPPKIPLFFKRLYPVLKRAETGAVPGIGFAISMKKRRSVKGRKDKE
jgi:hypothetical protein